MTERKPLSKKLRFEVFKRDSFTCQYCGRHAPDVILECDHIKPVAEGGKNTILNLVTSCMECNRGKGKRSLNNTAEVDKQFEQMAAINERREQLKMMLQWREELEKFENEQIDIIDKTINRDGYVLSDFGRNKVRMLIRKYSFDEVYESTQIAYNKYIVEQRRGFQYAFDKIGGICYNRANNIGSEKYGDKKNC